MLSRSTNVRGYSKKHQNTKKITKSFEKQEFLPESKYKVARITRKNIESLKENNKFKQIAIIRPIEIRSKDYENAIKAHLGIQRLSRDSSFSSINQKSNKRRNQSTESKLVDTSKTPHLPQISLELKRVNKPRQLSQKKLPRSNPISDDKDKEIELLQNSLNKINLLLNKLLHKSPK